jgi:hypothetical protein
LVIRASSGSSIAAVQPPIGWESRDRHRELVRIRRGYADWLGDHCWDHYADLTSEHPLSDLGLLRVFKGQWIRWLEKSAQNAVRWAVFSQRGEFNGRQHLHALLYGTAGLSVDQIDRAWRIGLARVRIFDPAKGAAAYITREIPENGEWDISARMPPGRSTRAPDHKLRNS